MRDMNPTQHPMEHPKFNPQSGVPVWYLSHPLAADEKHTFEENVEHCKKMVRMCIDEGFRVVAPYLTLIEVLDDNNLEHRRIGLETDCMVAYQLGRVIMTGHRISRGMQCELDAVNRRINDWLTMWNIESDEVRDSLQNGVIIDCTEMGDDELRRMLRDYKELQGFVLGG